jgi:hypothetical protein
MKWIGKLAGLYPTFGNSRHVPKPAPGARRDRIDLPWGNVAPLNLYAADQYPSKNSGYKVGFFDAGPALFEADKVVVR